MGVLYYDLGAMDQALDHLERVSKLAPKDSRPDRLMGSIYTDFEKYQLATKHYQISLQRDPNQNGRAELLLELAESQTNSADFKSARETLALCAESASRDALRAECCYALGDLEQALDLTAQVLEKTPEHLSSALLRAKILLGQDRAPEAAELLRETAELHPKDYLVRYTLSQAYSKIGDETKARQTLADSETLKKVWKEFSRLNTEAINQPRNAEIRYQLGVIAQDLDRADLAESWLRAALALDPGHEQAAAALAKNKEEDE
jgi:tetratricopeptide (TPR) repeat protein